MALVEITGPPAKIGTGTASGYNVVTTASFTPPASTLLIAMIAGGWANAGAAMSVAVTDSQGGTWTNRVVATGSATFDGLAVVATRWVTTSVAMTVTATFTNVTAGTLLEVRGVTGAINPQTGAATASYVGSSASTTAAATITPTTPGSFVYGAINDPNTATTITANGNTTISTPNVDSADSCSMWSAFLTSSTPATPAAIAFGGTLSVSHTSVVAVLEIVPLSALQATGMASIGAFGAASVALNVTATGLATAEAFGASAVTPALQATGIPSAQAFGASVVDAGIQPTGMPSAEAFGAAAVVVGPVALSPSGIASGETFGAAVILGSVINPTGIGSGEVFGTAALVPGPVALQAFGIPSGYTPGVNVVLQIITAISSQILIRPAPTTTYELVCMARVPQPSGPPTLVAIDPIDWTGLDYTEELSVPSSLSATATVSGLTEPVLQRLRNLEELASELWLYRNGKLIFSGPWLGWQVQGESVTLNAAGLLSYTKMMLIQADVYYKGIDQHLIAKGLIDQWQNLPYGNFGVDTSGVTASGVVRDIAYLLKELSFVHDKIADLGKLSPPWGFDIHVDPTSRKLVLSTPKRGVDRSTGQDAIIFDERNVTSPNVLCSVAPGDIGSEGFATGTGSYDTQFSQYFNATRRAQYGRSAVTATFDGIQDQASIDGRTSAMLLIRDQHLLVPGPDVRVTPDSDLSAYDVGDTVSYQLHAQLGVVGAYRLKKRQVKVSKTGQEAATLQFV